MDIQQLLNIIVECRNILVQVENQRKYFSLVDRIDKQLQKYTKSQKQQMNQKLHVTFQNNNLCPIDILKNVHLQQSQQSTNIKDQMVLNSLSQVIHSNKKQNRDLECQQSRFSSISLDRSVALQWENNSRIKQIQKEIKDSQLKRNSSETSSIQNFKSESPRKDKFLSNQSIQIQDFFIIDFNFQTNQYQILPQKKDYHKKSTLLQQKIKQQRYIQQEASFSNQKKGIFPFEQLQINSNISSQISEDTLRGSYQRYSTEAQLSYISQKSSSQLNLKSNNSYLQSQGLKRTLSQRQKFPSNKKKLTQSQIQEIYQSRQVILQLLLSHFTSHIKQIKPSSSMTDLLKLTTNPSSKNKKLQHIVIPSFIQIRNSHNEKECNKYTHIIKTYEGISYGMKYFQCERFYVLVEKHRKFMQVQSLVKGLIKKCYETRINSDKQVDNVKFSNIRTHLEQIALIPKNHLYLFTQKKQEFLINANSVYDFPFSASDKLAQVYFYCASVMKLKFTMQLPPNSQTRSFNLLLILIYFVIFQYKIIFLTTKNYEGIVSEVINALVQMIGQLRYVYPIILAVLSNHHIEFSNSPVPGLIGFWGSQSRYKKSVEYMKSKLREQASEQMRWSNKSSSKHDGNSQSTIVVDMNRHEFLLHSFTHQELYIIQNLHSFCNKRSKKENLIQTIKNLFNLKLLKHEKQQSQMSWINILRQRLQKSQMYEEYMKFKECHNSK